MSRLHKWLRLMGILERPVPTLWSASAGISKKLTPGFSLLALAFPLLWFVSNNGVDLLQKFLAMLFLYFVLRNRHLRKSYLILAAVILIVLLLWEFVWHFFSLPGEFSPEHPPFKYIYFFCFFLVIAYGTVAWKKVSPFVILAGAAVGLAAFLLVYSPLDHWQRSWQGERVAFGFRNAQHAGIFFGTGLLGISLMGHKLLRTNIRGLRVCMAIVVCAFAAVMLYGVIMTQVRAVWIGLTAAFLTVAMTAFMVSDVRSVLIRVAKQGYRRWIVMLILGLAVLLSAINIQGRIAHRIAQEEVSLESLQRASRFEQDKMTSSGIRIALWTAALDWIHEKPVLGWGAKTASRLIDMDPRFNEEFKKSFGHLHNSYLEALLSVGLLGVFSMAAIVILLAARVVDARRSGAMPKDVYIFAWAFFAFWATVNGFESYINYSSGFYVNTVVAAFLYAFYLQRRPILKRGEVMSPEFSFLVDSDLEMLMRASTVLEQDRHGIKVLSLQDGTVLKFFRVKRWWSSAMLRPYSLRFFRNSKKLHQLGIPTLSPLSLYRLPKKRMTAVHYEPLPGKTLRQAVEESGISQEFARRLGRFVADLHEKGVYFRSLHLGNIILTPAGSLGLIDVADTQFYGWRLSCRQRLRNLMHLCRLQQDRDILNKIGWPQFCAEYLAASGSARCGSRFTQRIQMLAG